MWFKEFFIDSVIAFFQALPTAAGLGYDGVLINAVVGIPLLFLFAIGCFKILLVSVEWLSTFIKILKRK